MAAQPQSWIAENQALVICRATPADAELFGKICFEAFGTFAEKHNFRTDFPAPESFAGAQMVGLARRIARWAGCSTELCKLFHRQALSLLTMGASEQRLLPRFRKAA